MFLGLYNYFNVSKQFYLKNFLTLWINFKLFSIYIDASKKYEEIPKNREREKI